MIPPTLAEFVVSEKTYRIAKPHGYLQLFVKCVDAFANVSWRVLAEQEVRRIFEQVFFEDPAWSMKWQRAAQKVGHIGACLVLDPSGLDPLLLHTYTESHGNHGRGGETYEVDVYRAEWATLAEPGAKSVKVWQKHPDKPREDVLLRALLLVVAP